MRRPPGSDRRDSAGSGRTQERVPPTEHSLAAVFKKRVFKYLAPDASVRLDLSTLRRVPFEDDTLLLIGSFAEDHANARRLAVGLEKLGLEVDPFPETNIVMFKVADASDFLRDISARGVLALAFSESCVRAVTHLDVSEADIDDALDRISAVVESGVR